jgi:hypothetical protein
LESYFLLLSFCAGNSSLLEAVKSHAYYGQMSGVQIPEGNPKHSPTSGEMAIYKAHCLMLRKVISNPSPSFVFTQKKILAGSMLLNMGSSGPLIKTVDVNTMIRLEHKLKTQSMRHSMDRQLKCGPE